MNDVVLESFIDFCDNMQIAEEGLTEIKNTIANTIDKLITAIKNLILKIKEKIGPKEANILVSKNQGKSKFFDAFNRIKKFRNHAYELSDLDAMLDPDNGINELENEYSSIMKDIKDIPFYNSTDDEITRQNINKADDFDAIRLDINGYIKPLIEINNRLSKLKNEIRTKNDEIDKNILNTAMKALTLTYNMYSHFMKLVISHSKIIEKYF